MNPLIQITRSGTIFSGHEENLKQMSLEFNKNHYIKLPKLIETKLLSYIEPYIEKGEFIDTINKNGIGLESWIKENPASHLLHFLANDQKLYKLIEEITGCRKIGCFDGRIYHVVSSRKDFDKWHDDNGKTRMITMSINLSKSVYNGGVLLIRDADTLEILHEIKNTGYVDAIIFQISPHLEHMVTDVDGEISKVAFAGWFQETPDYNLLIKKKSLEFTNRISKAELSTGQPIK